MDSSSDEDYQDYNRQKIWRLRGPRYRRRTAVLEAPSATQTPNLNAPGDVCKVGLYNLSMFYL